MASRLLIGQSGLRRLRQVVTAGGGVAIGGGLSLTLCSTPIPDVVYVAEDAARASEAETAHMVALREKCNTVSQGEVDRTSTAATAALKAAKDELRAVTPSDESLLGRLGIAILAVGATAGVMYKTMDDGGDNGKRPSMEAFLANWIVSSTPNLATAFCAAATIALVAHWRDREGNDLFSSFHSSLVRAIWRRPLDRSDQLEAEIERDCMRALDLHEAYDAARDDYEKLKKKPVDHEFKTVLKVYEDRMRRAREAARNSGAQVYRHRLHDTSSDVDFEAQQIRNRAKRLRERESELPFLDFLVGVTAVLCSGGSTVAAVAAWAVAVPVSGGLLHLFRHDTSAALKNLTTRLWELDERLKRTHHEKLY